MNIQNILELTTPKFSCVHSLYYHELCNTLYQRGVTWGKTIVSNSVPLKLDYTQYPFLKKPSHKKIFWFFILYIILGWFAPQRLLRHILESPPQPRMSNYDFIVYYWNSVQKTLFQLWTSALMNNLCYVHNLPIPSTSSYV